MGANDYAIVVGISKYYYDDLRSLDGAVEDAKKFTAWLASSDGGNVPPAHIKQILSTDYEKPQDFLFAQPVKNDIDNALITFGMNQTVRSKDRLYFYFTGHGLGVEFDDAALLLANASRQSPYDNLGFRKYRTHLRNASSFNHIIYFLDCCRSLDISVDCYGPKKGKGPITGDALGVDDYVFFATRHGREAFEPPYPGTLKKRGLFTQALLEALDEKKAADSQMRVTAGMLERYLSSRVPELSRQAKVPIVQTPECDTRAGSDFLLVRAESLPNVRIRVIAEPGLGGTFVLCNGLYNEISRFDAAQTPWDRELPVPGLFPLLHYPSGREEIINTREIKDNPHVYHFGR